VALNFLGLGFSFGAKDIGLEKTQEKIASNFFKVSEGIASVHEKSQPAFSQVEKSLDAVDQVLARQEGRVAIWSQGVADKVDDVVDSFKQIGSVFTPITDAVKKGGEVVKATFEGTFGESIKGVTDKVTGLGDRFKSIVAAAEPITSKVTPIFKRVAEAARPFTERLQGLKEASAGFRKDLTRSVFDTLKKAAFFFGKKAADIGSSQEKISEGFGSIKEVVGKLDQILNVNKLRGFIESISLAKLGNISSGIQNLTGSSLNLTTGLEAQGAAAAKSARATAFNLGLTGKELRNVSSQAAGMSIGLNIGAETATAAIVGFKTATSELGAVGIRTASDLAKLSDVTGINGKVFAHQMKRMRTEFSMTDEDLSRVTSTFVKMGQETGDVSAAMNQLPQMMELISRRAALMEKNLSPEELADFAAQTASLSAGLFTMTGDADKAREMSISLAEATTAAQESFVGLFSGVGDDIPQFMKEFAIMSGDVNKSMDLIKQGPAGMVKGLAQMAVQVKSSGGDMAGFLEFVRARLTETMGAQQAATLVNFLRTANDETVKTMETVSGATVDLGKMAREGHSTGRTLQESFDLAKDGMIASFRSLGKARESFVKDSVKQFGEFSKTLRGVVKKGGPMGDMVELMADMHSIGAMALLPKTLRPMGTMLGVILENLTPIIAALGGLIFLFGPVGILIGGLVAGIGLLSAQLIAARMETDNWADAWDKFTEKLVNGAAWLENVVGKAIDAALNALVSITDRMADFAAKVDWKAFFEGVFKRIGSAIKTVSSVLRSVAGELLGGMFGGMEQEAKDPSRVGKIVENLKTVFTSIVGGLKAAMGKMDWGATLDMLLDGLQGAMTGLMGLAGKIPFDKIFNAIFGAIETVLKGLGGDRIGKLLNIIVGFLMARVQLLGKAFFALVEAALGFLAKMDLGNFVGGLVEKVLKLVPTILQGLLPLLEQYYKKLPEFLEKGVGIILGVLKTLPGKVGDALKDLGPKLKVFLKGLVPVILEGMLNLGKFIYTRLPGIILGAIPTVLNGLKKLLFGIQDLLVDVITGIWEGIRDFLMQKFPKLAKYIGPAFDSVSTLLKKSMGLWQTILDTGIKALGKVFEWLKKGWDAVFGKSTDDAKSSGFMKTIDFLIDEFSDLVLVTIKVGKTIWDTLAPAFSFLAKVAKTQFSLITKVVTVVWETFKLVAHVVQRVLGVAFKILKGIALMVWDQIKMKWETAVAVFTFIFTAVQTVVTAIFTKVKEFVIGVWELYIKPVWNKVAEFFRGVFEATWTLIGPYITKIKDAMVQLWTLHIKPVWDKVKQFFQDTFTAIWKAVEFSINQIKNFFGGAHKDVDKFFDGIDEWVDKLFRHSIHTDIEKDLNASVEALQAGANKITEFLEKDFHAAVVKGINKAFTDAFKKAIDATKKFVIDQEKMFRQFLLNISRLFSATFLGIAGMTDAVTGALAKSVADVKRDLDKISAGFRAVEASRVAAAAAKEDLDREEGPRTELPALPAGLERLEYAVNNPDWYREPSSGYQALFIAKMDALISATLTLKSEIASARNKGPSMGGAAATVKEILRGQERMLNGQPLGGQTTSSGEPAG